MIKATLLSAIALFIIVVTTPRLTPDNPSWNCPCDHLAYMSMAEGHRTIAPFTWRLLNLAFARLLPLPLVDSFTVLTITWLWLVGISTYGALRRIKFSENNALLTNGANTFWGNGASAQLK
jgi:hypothetical protein